MSQKPSKSVVRRQWFRSVALMCIIPFALGVIICFISVFQFRTQLQKNSDVFLTEIRSLEDQALKAVKLIMEDVRQSEALGYLATYGQASSQAETVMYKRQLQQTLNNYKVYNAYIDSIYVYFWESDEFVTSETAGPSGLLFQAYHQIGALTYEDWLSGIRSYHKGEACLMPITDSSTGYTAGSWSNKMAYMKAYPWFEMKNCEATIFILMDTEAILSMSHSLSQNSTSTYDLLIDDNLLLQRTTDPHSEPLRYDNGFYRVRLDNGDQMTLLPSLEVSGVYHVLISSAQKVNVTTLGVFWVFLAGLGLMIVLAVLFGHRFVRRNYKPIAEIMEELPLSAAEQAANSAGSINEFTTIRSSLANARDEQASLREQLLYRNDLLTEETLILLLMGNTLSDRQTMLLRQVLPYDRFSVILVQSARSDPEDNAPVALNAEQLQDLNTNLAAFLQKNLVTYAVKATQIGLQTAVVLNDPNIGNSLTPEVVQELAGCLREDFPELSVLLSYSSSRTGMELLPICYEEAYYTLEYERIFGVDFHSVHQNWQQGWVMPEYKYDRQDEERLSLYVSQGDSARTVALLEELWNTNIERKISHSMLHCFLFNIAGTLIRMCNIITPAKTILPNLNEMVQQLSQGSQELDVCFEGVCRFADEICRCYNREYQQTNVVLKDQVLAYIEKNCSDPSLSVESISDAFGKSRSYLFMLFKESTGNSILYHINIARMQKARKLLCDSRLSVKDVAESCGFNSTANFSRVFKKYEGVQPSEYRTRHQQTGPDGE